jgi:hypothetical protein
MDGPHVPPVPTADVPALAVRVEGLVVVVDAVTLNALARRAVRDVPEVQAILVEPEDGRLSISLRIRKGGFPIVVRAHLTDLRLKDALLGFHVADARALGLPVPRWVIRSIVDRQPAGQIFYYEDQQVIVVNLGPLFPSELTVNVPEVVCDAGEVRLLFGTTAYRLDRLLE